MSSVKTKAALEGALSQMHERQYCLMAPRATTAITVILKALGFRGGKVVVPSVLCLNPANAILYAGLTPVYCDMDLNDFNLDIEDLEKILKAERGVRALILPHCYGQPADIEEVLKLCRRYNVILIEDAAQALGGEYKGRPLGSFGDFSVLSFGHTKILDAGSGGAILFNDKRYRSAVVKEIRALPAKAKNYEELSRAYPRTYYTFAEFFRKDAACASLYRQFPEMFRDLYIHNELNAGTLEKILKGLKGLRQAVQRRRENAEFYRKVLRHPKIRHPEYKWNGVCWRYSFMITGDKQFETADLIRNKGVHVSNWYPPVHLMYEQSPRRLKNAEYLASHVFNLWVDEGYSKQDIKKSAQSVLKVLER